MLLRWGIADLVISLVKPFMQVVTSSSEHSAAQVRDLQRSLEAERDQSAHLKRQVVALREELHAKDCELQQVLAAAASQRRRFVTDTPSSSLWSIASSASSTPSSASRDASASRRHRENVAVPKTTRDAHKRAVTSAKSQKHRFVTGLNTKATNCGVCLGSVLFVRTCAKCEGLSSARFNDVTSDNSSRHRLQHVSWCVTSSARRTRSTAVARRPTTRDTTARRCDWRAPLPPCVCPWPTSNSTSAPT